MNIHTNPKVDWFFEKSTQWQEAYKELRRIILECGLVEELKWGVPCYTFDGSNIVLIHGFKNYCALLFHMGVLLKDTEDILIQQTEYVQAARQIRFTRIDEIKEMEKVIENYIYEAVEVEKAGIKVPMKETEDYPVADEFQEELDENAELKAAFEGLTPGRQRDYLLYFSSAKQSKTRKRRVEKFKPKILNGKGRND